MLIVYIAICLVSTVNSVNITLPKADTNLELRCVMGILKKYVPADVALMYVDMQYDDNSVLKAIGQEYPATITMLWPSKLMTIKKIGYLILAKNIPVFVDGFLRVVRQPRWNPRARFIVIVKNLDVQLLRDIFDQFLLYHVSDVHVLDGFSHELYTYDPFSDYGCGKSYEEVIHNGKCSEEVIDKLFPVKLTTGLRNCTLTVLASNDWLPFTTEMNSRSSKFAMGSEQFMFNIFAELEHFDVNYIYIDGDFYSNVDANMSASGSLQRIQNNEVDVQMGGMLMSPNRANAFDYVWTHLPFRDSVIIVVKKTQDIAVYKNMYGEFQPVVWILLLVTYVAYFLITTYLFKVADKCGFALKLLDALFLHSYRIPSKFDIRPIYISWIWFGYLMNLYYQTSLTSYSVRPLREYQVSSEEDLVTYKFKSCISNTILSVLSVDKSVHLFDYESHEAGCSSILESTNTVSRLDNLYTMTFLSLYIFQTGNLTSIEDKKALTYRFEKPVFKLVYGVYLYKGFPLTNKFNMYGLWLMENGMLEKFLKDLYSLIASSIKVKEKKDKLPIIPWTVFIFGCGLAFLVFLLELIIGNKDRLMRCMKL